MDQIIGDLGSGIQTRSQTEEHSIISGQATANFCFYTNFLSVIEPKKVDEALRDDDWVEAMQEELTEFERNIVWTLIPAPAGKTFIGTKWVFRSNMDADGVVIRNKARLVAQGY